METLVAKNTKEAMPAVLVAPMVGFAESTFGGSVESCGLMCVGEFASYTTSVSVKMFHI